MASILKGVAQIFFLPNWVTGLLIVAGVAVFSPVAALFLLLGSAVQEFGAWAVRTDDVDRREGLMGFNGALVGVAAWAHAPTPGLAVLLAVLGALAVVAVHECVGRLFSLPVVSAAGLTVSTAPFCLTASAMFLLLPELKAAGELSSSPNAVAGAAMGVLNSFAEVVLADGWLTGALILIGLVIGAPGAAGFGLAGAVIGVAGAVAVGGVEAASTGMYSYSAVLAAMALGAIFWSRASRRTRWLGVIAAAGLSVAVTWVMTAAGGPVFTWPYLIATWAVMVVAAILTRPAVARSVPEV